MSSGEKLCVLGTYTKYTTAFRVWQDSFQHFMKAVLRLH